MGPDTFVVCSGIAKLDLGSVLLPLPSHSRPPAERAEVPTTGPGAEALGLDIALRLHDARCAVRYLGSKQGVLVLALVFIHVERHLFNTCAAKLRKAPSRLYRSRCFASKYVLTLQHFSSSTRFCTLLQRPSLRDSATIRQTFL